MYYLNEFCCICLNNDDHLITLSEKDEDGLTYFQKLTDCVPEMNSDEIDPDKFICVGCIDGLDEVYYFRVMCIENKIVFLDYLTKLTSVGEKNGFLDVKVLDIHGNDKKKQKKISKTKDVARSNFHKKMKLSLKNPMKKTEKQEVPTVSNGNNPEIKLKILNNTIVRENENIGNNFEIKPKENKSKTIGNKCKMVGNKLKKIGRSSEMSETIILVKKDDINDPVQNIYSDIVKKEIVDNEIVDNQIKEEPIDIVDKQEIKQEMIEDESKENNMYNDVIPDKIGAKLMKMTLNDEEMFLPRENDYEDNQMSTSSCSNNSLEQDRLKPMIKRITSSKEIFCKFCEQTFEERKLLETHVCIDKISTQTDCKYCYKHFKTPNDLCDHLCDGYEQNNLFRCEICNVIFPTQLKLINHENVRHGAIKHQCRICEKGFGHLMPLRDHLTNDHHVKPHMCDICQKSYVHPRDLRTHINKHKGWKPYNCRLCNRDFFGQSELRRHMKSHD